MQRCGSVKRRRNDYLHIVTGFATVIPLIPTRGEACGNVEVGLQSEGVGVLSIGGRNRRSDHRHGSRCADRGSAAISRRSSRRPGCSSWQRVALRRANSANGRAMERACVIVLDTHVLVWWAAGMTDKLGRAAVRVLDSAQGKDASILVSAISAWEIAVLIEKGRLVLAMDVEEWLSHIAALPEVRFVPVDRHTAVQSVRLPGTFHADPADRLIVATARRLNLPLVTADEQIREYPHVRSIW